MVVAPRMHHQSYELDWLISQQHFNTSGCGYSLQPTELENKSMIYNQKLHIQQSRQQ